MLRTVLFVALVASPLLLQAQALSLENGETANIFVRFRGGNTLAVKNAARFQYSTRGETITHLVQNLKAFTEMSQKNAISLVENTRSVKYQQFWITNELYVEGAPSKLVNELRELPEVEDVVREQIVHLESYVAPKTQDPVGWNLERIEVPQAWALPGGNEGEGVVVASIDTGVRYTHEALQSNFRTSYGWFDPYDQSDLPADQTGSGTGTMGVLAGSGGIGIAPSAQWVSCRGCSTSSCTQAALLACGQWITCPTLPNGESEDCTQAPNLVMNSWGGGQGSTWFNQVIEIWKLSNIVPFFANGGGGPSCGSVGSPADQDVIGVGATIADDNIASFSGRGPASGGAIKPDLVAPGQSIRTSWNTDDTAYQTLSGTSFSVPHAAGVAALVLSTDPDLTYAQVRAILEENADQDLPSNGEECGGIPDNIFPNNKYGHGRVNARKALEAAINGRK